MDESGITTSKIELPKHWFWDEWKYLALSAAVCFSAANLLIGDVAHLGFTSFFYFNSGAMLVCIVYFSYPKFRTQNKRFIFAPEGKFDFNVLVLYLGGALFVVAIFGAINTTFYFCHRAGLNIGIAATIWGFTAILSSIMEYNFYGTEL